jgi:transposase-like protein
MTPTRRHRRFTNEEKDEVLTYILETGESASAAAKKFGISARSVQHWQSNFNSQKQLPIRRKGNSMSLNREHKRHIQSYVDKNQKPTIEDIHRDLCSAFEDLKITKHAIDACIKSDFTISLSLAPRPSLTIACDATTETEEFVAGWSNPNLDYLKNCIFFDVTAFNLTKKKCIPWSNKYVKIMERNYKPQQKRGIMVAMCSVGVMNLKLQVPNHQESHQNQYINFILETTSQMASHYSGCFIVVNGLPAEHQASAKVSVTANGFKYLRVPEVDCELDPCQQFWDVLLSNVDRKNNNVPITERFINASQAIENQHLIEMINKCDANFRQYFGYI